MQRSNKEITKASYEATAEEFARNVSVLAPTESIQYFMSLLPTHPKIIDIGCGSGRDAKIFTDLGSAVTGIDFCSNLLNIAQQNSPTAQFQLMDIEALDFPESSFDGAWAACSLGHLSKASFSTALKKIHFILKENGYFYLALKKGIGETLEPDLRYDGHYEKFWSFFEEEELRNYLKAADFNILNINTIEKQYDYQTHDALRVICQKMT